MPAAKECTVTPVVRANMNVIGFYSQSQQIKILIYILLATTPQGVIGLMWNKVGIICTYIKVNDTELKQSFLFARANGHSVMMPLAMQLAQTIEGRRRRCLVTNLTNWQRSDVVICVVRNEGNAILSHAYT